MHFKISPVISETFVKPVVKLNVAVLVTAAIFSIFLVTVPLTAPIIYFSFKRVQAEYREAKQRVSATQEAAEAAAKSLKERKIQAAEIQATEREIKAYPLRDTARSQIFQRMFDTDVEPDYTNFVIPQGVHKEKFLRALNKAANVLNIAQTKEGDIIQYNTREALTPQQKRQWFSMADAYYRLFMSEPSFESS